MPAYTLYFMNSVSGHIGREETLHAGDDVAATCLIQGRNFNVPVELWRDGKKVAREVGPPNLLRKQMFDAVVSAQLEPKVE
jgi:hypothetical protein